MGSCSFALFFSLLYEADPSLRCTACRQLPCAVHSFPLCIALTERWSFSSLYSKDIWPFVI